MYFYPVFIWLFICFEDVLGGVLHADWMANLPMKLQDIPLTQLAIPGSHDSGSYSLKDNEVFMLGLQHENTAFATYFKRVFDQQDSDTLGKIMYRWSKTQDLNISQQLQSGIRYLDLRIAYNSSGNIRIVHGLFGTTLEDILIQIHTYVEEHPKEIIILDVNHIYITSSKLNYASTADSITQILISIFKKKLCSASEEMTKYTVAEIWRMKCQVISFLAAKPIRNNIVRPSNVIQSPFSYNKFTQKSPWLHFLDLNYKHKRQPGTFHVTQGIMQPHWMEIAVAGLSDKATLKEWVADEATQDIVKWVHNKHIGPNGINIVIADFIEDHNFTDTVIKLNVSNSCNKMHEYLIVLTLSCLGVLFILIF